MSNDLTIFEGQTIEILTKEDVSFEFKGTALFNGNQISKMLGYSEKSKPINKHVREDQRYLVKNSDVLNQHFRKLNNAGEIFLTEHGVMKLIINSDMLEANKLEDKIWDIVSQIQRTGRFDSTENNIMLIEDETERNLELAIYNLRQTLNANPNDMLMQFAYKSKVTDLTTYKQSRELKLLQGQIEGLEDKVSGVKADTELIKGQQMFVCDRTNFSEKMVILANKYFGRDKSKAYNALFAKMKLLGSFDVYARRKNEWDKINEERVAEGKDPYKESTLKGKVNYLDVIDKNGKWGLCSEAYKTIETEEYTGALHIV